MNGIQLVFVFGKKFDRLYFVNMDKWYSFIGSTLKFGKLMNGKTYVMNKKFGHLIKNMPNKGNVDLFEYYNVHSVECEECGENVKKWFARAYIDGSYKDVELSCGYSGWYFENGSKYIIIDEDMIKKMCNGGAGHIINT